VQQGALARRAVQPQPAAQRLDPVLEPAQPAAVQTRANHLRSAGMTYHGARRVLVADSISEKAFW
jgi:hypothetical protein